MYIKKFEEESYVIKNFRKIMEKEINLEKIRHS